MTVDKEQALIPIERVERAIHVIRGHKVMLDADLAALYGVTTGNLNKAVRRNALRFPEDFVFRLTAEEEERLLFQSGRTKTRGGRRTLPYAFTEYGVAMLSSVLNSERAVLVNISIMRAFGRLRQFVASHHDLVRRLDALESKYDAQFRSVFAAIRALVQPAAVPGRPIGFAPPARRTKAKRPR